MKGKTFMLKSVQIRIILIIILLATIMMTGYGLYSIKLVKNLNIENQIVQENIIILAIVIISFIAMSLITIWFASKIITKPIYKLIKSAERISDGEENKKTKIDNMKRNTEIDDLVNAFEGMTRELKENLNEVTRQKNQMETILRHMTDGIIAFNINGDIIHINPAATKLLKINKESKKFNDIFKHIDAEIILEKIIYLEDWTATEKKINIDEKYLNIFFASFKDENERPAGVIVLIQDITEHIKLDNMRKEFIADVSHELKTPLTSIMGYAETLSDSEYDPEMQEKFLKVISSETVRMTKLVNDLLILSKYDNEEARYEKIEFSLGDLVKSCQENLQIEIDKKEQKVECFVTANVPNIYADKDGIERVILNILSNSIKYTEERWNNKNLCRFCV